MEASFPLSRNGLWQCRRPGMIKHKSGTRWPDNREVGSRCVRSTPYIRRRGRWLVSGLASKPLGQFLLVWPQNRWVRVFQFVPENPQIRFGDLRVEITLTISCFGLQNQADYSLSVVLQYRREVEHGAGTHWDLADCFTWKQVGLGFPSLTLRLVEAWCGWCRWYHRMNIALSWSWRQTSRCDGLHQTFLFQLCHFLCIRP
jgi:hypothetical protein